MEDLTIKKIIQKIKKINIQDIIKLKNEEGSGYYNVWKVVTPNSKYILKQTTEKELNNYLKLKISLIPNFYGYTKYYNNI